MNHFGADFQYKIPYIRTRRVERLLNKVWKELC
jgi:hypothetical protein